ncbi:MAG: hypothetical protein ACXWKT_00990 [Caulobacteraceae bacterium]
MRQKNHYSIPSIFSCIEVNLYFAYVSIMPSNEAFLDLIVMGRPVVIRASDPALLAIAAAAYADWPMTGPADGLPIRLDLETSDAVVSGPLEIEVEDLRLRLTGAVEGWADARALTAFCRVSRDLAEQPGFLAGEVIDTLLLFLLCRSGRTPLHAAGVICGETAVLLAGPSGSGKSTLSLAALTRGLQILSDDTVYIQMLPRLRIWGLPRPLHVFPADAPRFTQGTRLRGGKLKAAVAVPPWPGPPVAEEAAVVVLERGDRVRLEPIEPSIAAAALSRLEPGFDLLAKESAQAIAAVTAFGTWRLTLTRDPGAAIDALMDRFGLGVVSVAARSV